MSDSATPVDPNYEREPIESAPQQDAKLLATVSEQEFLTADEVAALLRVDRKTVYEAAKKRELPVIQIGKIFRFPREQLMRYSSPQVGGSLEARK